MQSQVSPGGGVGTNFVKARSRLGSPRMPQHTPRTERGEAGPRPAAWISVGGGVSVSCGCQRL